MDKKRHSLIKVFLCIIRDMKHLRGCTRQYFSLAVIAMYSTLHKLSRLESNYQYHKLAYRLFPLRTAPPSFILSSTTLFNLAR